MEFDLIDHLLFGNNIESPTVGFFRTIALVTTGMVIHEFTRGSVLNAIGGADLVRKRNIAAGKAVKSNEETRLSVEDMQ